MDVNGCVRTSPNFPVGLFHGLSIEKTNEHFRILYNVAKKFHLHKISSEEAAYRLAKVTKKYSNLDIPYIVTNCATSFRFCNPEIDISYTGVDKVVFVSKGKARGRIGIITNIDIQGTEIIYGIADFEGNAFSCIYRNCILIGESKDDI